MHLPDFSRVLCLGTTVIYSSLSARDKKSSRQGKNTLILRTVEFLLRCWKTSDVLIHDLQR